MNQTHGSIPENLRDAIVAAYLGKLDYKDAPRYYDVPSRSVHAAMEQIKAIDELRKKSGQEPLLQNENRRQIFRWATKFTKATCKKREKYTHHELIECIYHIVTCKLKAKDAFEEYGVSKTTFGRYMNKVFNKLDVSRMKELKMKYQLKYITDSTLRKTLQTIDFRMKGQVPNLLPDEESLLVATAEMKCYASKPQQARRLAGQANSLLRKMVESGVSKVNPDIKHKSKIQYVRRVLKRVMKREPDLRGKRS